MLSDLALLAFSLALILLSAEIFTNGVEALGKRLALSQAVVGSIFAAVGTAMPETILPFVAILLYGGDAGVSIGVGEILGAPFMLATLAFFLVGIAVLFGYKRGKRAFEFRVDAAVIKRDLIFFISMYSAAIFMPLIAGGSKVILAVFLVVAYFVYVWLTFKCESRGMIHVEELYIGRLVRFFRRRGRDETPVMLVLIAMQVICSLVIMVGGAHLFVEGLEKLSSSLGISPLLFALLAAPVATELPEKFNSVTWTLKGKDALAAGNITGAMVFQSAFPVSLGLIFTDWTFSGTALLSAVMALAAAIIILADVLIRKRLSPVTMISTGLLYLAYAAVIVLNH